MPRETDYPLWNLQQVDLTGLGWFCRREGDSWWKGSDRCSLRRAARRIDSGWCRRRCLFTRFLWPWKVPYSLEAGIWYSLNKTKADDPVKGQDCWIGLTGENFKIRGPNYLNDRKKIMSERCVFRCLCCELINSANRLEHFSQNSKSLVQKLRREGYKGFIYVYNIMVTISSWLWKDR